MYFLEHRARKYPLFLTMRHPYKVARSWINRGWDLGPLFFAEWWNLFHLQETYGGHWLPIDTEDRDERLKAASAAIGVQLRTDWKPFMETTTYHRDEGAFNDAKMILKRMPFYQFGYVL